MVTDEQPPSVPSTPEPADSADSLSHAIAQNAVHSAVADAEEDGPVPAAAPPPPQAPADNMGANGPVPEPQPGEDFGLARVTAQEQSLNHLRRIAQVQLYRHHQALYAPARHGCTNCTVNITCNHLHGVRPRRV